MIVYGLLAAADENMVPSLHNSAISFAFFLLIKQNIEIIFQPEFDTNDHWQHTFTKINQLFLDQHKKKNKNNTRFYLRLNVNNLHSSLRFSEKSDKN